MHAPLGSGEATRGGVKPPLASRVTLDSRAKPQRKSGNEGEVPLKTGLSQGTLD